MHAKPLSFSESDATDSDPQPTSPRFYREFLAEREEILKHKYCMSQKVGNDVGFDAALVDWVLRHRGSWIEARPQRLAMMN